MTIDAARSATSEAETVLIGRALGRLLRGGDVLLLDGDLGAGKTTLVRALAEGMGLATRAVASPTFVMIHEYARDGGPATPHQPDLVHVDAYRLAGPDELDSLGWDAVMDRVGRGDAVLVIEWAQRLGEGFLSDGPAATPAHLRIEHSGVESREFFFALPDSWRSRPGLGDLLARRASACPITGRRVEPDSPTYPFADERARMADLYRWFSGGYTTSREITDADAEET